MNRFVIAFIAAFVFIFLWGWLYNGVLLKDVFAEAQSLFRPREEMMGLFHWIGFIEMIVTGVIVGAIYKPKSTA
jgi:Na+/H+ antiporter NhaC